MPVSFPDCGHVILIQIIIMHASQFVAMKHNKADSGDSINPR